MRRATFIIGLCALVAAGSTAAGARPRITLTSTAPVKVHGVGFKARERVVVRVTQDGQAWKRVAVASTTGVFNATFPTAVELSFCEAVTVFASGRQGDHAQVRRKPLPGIASCAP